MIYLNSIKLTNLSGTPPQGFNKRRTNEERNALSHKKHWYKKVNANERSQDQHSSGEFSIDIIKIAKVILSKLWIVVLVALVSAVAAYFYTAKLVTPTYTSTARVYILNRQNSSATSATDLTSATSIKEDFLILIKSNEIYRQVLTRIGEDPSDYRKLASKISTDNNNSRFVDITITDTDPMRAKILVDAFADISRVKAKEIMGVEDVTIEEYGTIATAPSSPSMSKNIILGVLLGIILSCGCIAVISIFSTKISTQQDIEKETGLCVLGVIPDYTLYSSKKRARSGNKKQ